MAIAQPKADARGFSLLELLVVLVLISAVAALTAPRMSHALAGLELKSLSGDMARSLRATRLAAIQSGQSLVWVLDLEQPSYQSGTGSIVHFDEAIGIELTTIAKEQHSDQRGQIRFFADGSTTGGEVSLSHGRINYQIQVDWLTGRVSIYGGQG